jgi:hypothetical protein
MRRDHKSLEDSPIDMVDGGLRKRGWNNSALRGCPTSGQKDCIGQTTECKAIFAFAVWLETYPLDSLVL